MECLSSGEPTLKPQEGASFLRLVADYMESHFPPDMNVGPMVKVFFNQALEQMSVKERLILAARIIEGIDNNGLVLFNRMTMVEARKRKLTE